jgi:hypothetical protein
MMDRGDPFVAETFFCHPQMGRSHSRTQQLVGIAVRDLQELINDLNQNVDSCEISDTRQELDLLLNWKPATNYLLNHTEQNGLEFAQIMHSKTLTSGWCHFRVHLVSRQRAAK